MKPTITITSEDGNDTPDRLRALLAAAEDRQNSRFALITFGDGMIITTSAKEPTDFDRLLLACFSREAMSTDAAWHAGVARGIALALKSFEEHGEDDAPAVLDEMKREHSKDALVATVTAGELTRVAMAPFGLEALAEKDVVVWRNRDAEAAE
jgi:hypothetical protein